MTRVLEQLPHDEKRATSFVETCANKIEGKKSRSPPEGTRDYDNSIKDLRPAVETTTLAVVDAEERDLKRSLFIPVTM